WNLLRKPFACHLCCARNSWVGSHSGHTFAVMAASVSVVLSFASLESKSSKLLSRDRMYGFVSSLIPSPLFLLAYPGLGHITTPCALETSLHT
ncbi:hypothetical protein EDD16DRAFT_1611730, partial [Pisolithus croceorrhizus]